jgi:hypothetical protein
MRIPISSKIAMLMITTPFSKSDGDWCRRKIPLADSIRHVTGLKE